MSMIQPFRRFCLQVTTNASTLTTTRFLLLAAASLVATSAETKAQENVHRLTLTALQHQVAIPHEITEQVATVGLSARAQRKELAQFAQAQADLECLTHRCGSAPCVRAVSFQIVKAPATRDSVLRIPNRSHSRSSLKARDWDFYSQKNPPPPLPSSHLFDDYFTTIVCSSQPTKSNFSSAVIPETPAGSSAEHAALTQSRATSQPTLVPESVETQDQDCVQEHPLDSHQRKPLKLRFPATSARLKRLQAFLAGQ